MKRLGDVLISEDLVSPQQLNLALQEQKRTGELLGDVLLRLGILTRKELCRVIAAASDLPYVDLKMIKIDPEAIKLVSKDLVKKFRMMPFSLKNMVLKVAMDNPSDVIAIDILRRSTQKQIEVYAADLESILEIIEIYYEVGPSIEDQIDKSIYAAMSGKIAEGEAAPPIIRLLELFIINAIRKIASDIHITPEEKASRVSYRIDGILRSDTIFPKSLHNAVVSRVKVLSSLNIAEQRIPQEGGMFFEFSGRKIDIRSSTSPGKFGENIVLRILDKANILMGLEYLGLNKKDELTIQKLSLKPYGILLVSGPTGSGKTTTLYSMLRKINALEKSIITIEDPIEYNLPLIKQTQVNEQAGLTFNVAIRHFLRQDPDIILVGEIRDLETASIAFRAAMTGHLVLSTIHTNDSASTIARLLDLGVEPYLIPTSLRAVIAQRLVRRLCKYCKKDSISTQEELILYDLEDWPDKDKRIKRAVGCPECNLIGYHGRDGIFELMEISHNISRLITQKAPADIILFEAKKEGMRTLREDGLDKVLAGLTTIEEIARVA